MKERIKKIFALNPRVKKTAGVILVAVGFAALITPLTPGSWLIFVGLELLGFDLIFWSNIKAWFRKIRSPAFSAFVKNEKTETAVFGGGCFWCTEAVFKMLRGVKSVAPGYSGGSVKNPTYEQVSGGQTGHAEAVRIEYDPSRIAYRDLLAVFFGSHDPTTANRQGNDVGAQYRSVIFYTTPEQKKVAENFIKEINDSNEHGLLARHAQASAPVVTELMPFDVFYEAENYHRDYFASHSGNPYCEVVINPKLEKVQKQFAELLKTKENQN